MTIFNTYSKSQKGLPDVYKYDVIDLKLRNQIFHIWVNFFDQQCWEDLEAACRREIYKTICQEEGLKELVTGHYDDPEAQVEYYFEGLKDPIKILDVVQITFHYMEALQKLTLDGDPYANIGYKAEAAIKDLNCRFRENGVGYEYSAGKIIRVDHKLLHRETIQPALFLLTEKKFKNANAEYLHAHEHYKQKRNKECLNECLKAFESTMKIICSENRWTYGANDTAATLISVLINNSFLPTYNESSLNGLRQLLISAIPSPRNKMGAHGSGETEIVVPDSLANYILYVTGATIKLLVDTQNNRKK